MDGIRRSDVESSDQGPDRVMRIPGKPGRRFWMSDREVARVLVVDDEPDLAEAYGTWLEPDYDVTVFTDGASVLSSIDETIDVVLLDRRMPDLTGDEVLDTIRDRNLDCRVAMVTAVNPEFDVIEMGFDAYLTKPVSSVELRETVDRLLQRIELDGALQEYYSLVEKQATLEASKSPEELEGNEQYQRLESNVDRLREELASQLRGMDNDETFVATIRDLDEISGD
jgi:DNA-binding response OmpR family regulator